MNIKEAIEYIHNRSWRTSRLGLERIGELLSQLGNPQNRLKFVHVAGTNGKGSICAMLSSILVQAGYKTGLYISPYIHRFNERIQINGLPISDGDLISITERAGKYADQMEDHPTEFELITAMAMDYFARENCDIIVLEVGLGGRLDATNIIQAPEVAVLSSISLDHVEQLGNTIEKIAAEKSGIIKPGGSVVLYPQAPEAAAVIENICLNRNASLFSASMDSLRIESSSLSGHCFSYGIWNKIYLPLAGGYQPKNAATALTAVAVLRQKGWNISDDAVFVGLKETSWPVRFEIIHQNPCVIVDGGHNPQCVRSIAEDLQKHFPNKKPTILLGVMQDKNYSEMLDAIVHLAERIVAVTPDNHRALPAQELARYILSKGFNDVSNFDTVTDGLRFALRTAKEDDLICAFGSFYMAGTIREYFGMNGCART